MRPINIVKCIVELVECCVLCICKEIKASLNLIRRICFEQTSIKRKTSSCLPTELNQTSNRSFTKIGLNKIVLGREIVKISSFLRRIGMDLIFVATILVLFMNLHFNTILAFPKSSVTETNPQNALMEDSSKNAHPYGHTFAAEKELSATPASFMADQPNMKSPKSTLSYGYADLGAHDLAQNMLRIRRSFEQPRPFPNVLTADELTTLLLSKSYSNGQNPESFFKILSLLTAANTAKPAVVDNYADNDFSYEDEAPIELVNGRKPHTFDIVPNANQGRDPYWDDTPIVLHTNHKNGRKIQKKNDWVLNGGRMYSLGQLLQNSQNFDSNVPVHRRYIL